MGVRQFVDEHYRHFNAGSVQRTAASLLEFLNDGGKMFITLAGAMSTAELGRSLADMIRAGHVAGISCTGANLEEDVFNLVAHSHYVKIPDYENLSPMDEHELLQKHLNRVTDTCIPEEEAIRKIEHHIFKLWDAASKAGTSSLPHEYLYELLRSKALENEYEIDPSNAWLLAAAEQDLPLFVPGWEDSTLGNIFAARSLEGKCSPDIIKGGIHYMHALIEFYLTNSAPLGFFQIGGGIAGDFPICVVPLLHQDMELDAPLWSWFAQITDATASYGGYSGAPPNEKITWGKVGVDTPRFSIHSDATIVAPLIFAYILDL